MNDAGVRFVGTLRQDHLDEFRHHIHVGVLNITLLNRAQAFGTARGSDDGIPRSCGLQQKIAADAVQAAGIGKRSELDSANLLSLCLARELNADGAIGADRDIRGARRNGDGRLELVAIRGDDDASGIQMK